MSGETKAGQGNDRGSSRYVPHLIGALIVLVALLIPLKIVREGYLPDDDALRYAAKSVTAKPWSEIVVLGSNYTVDHNFGYDWLLRRVHLITNWAPEQMLDFTLVGLFALMAVCGLPWLKRPEAWLGALLLGVVGWPALAQRTMVGRPLLLTAFVVLTIFFLWYKRKGARPDWPVTFAMAAMIFFTVWTHGVWYLWVLPIAAFLLAGELSWAVALGRAWVMGSVLAALATGHPMAFLYEAILMAMRATAMHPTARTMVSEFQPMSGGLLIFLVFGAMLLVRRSVKLEARSLTMNPIFWLAAMGWVLGFVARRFWEDWGLWAMLALVACDLSLVLEMMLPKDSLKRLALAGTLALSVYISVTSDLDSRWTRTLSRQYLVESDPDLAGWLPDHGGIVYAADPQFFYETFFKNPNADWRYLLGFEMTLMPEDDFDVLYRILWNNAAGAAFQPWVAKMQPQDRLFVRGEMSAQPPISGLEWHYLLGGMWSGRVLRGGVPGAK